MSPISFGQSVDWTNGNGGTFSTGSNWAGGAAPNSNQIANFNIANAEIGIAFTTPTTTRGLTVGNGNYLFSLGGNTYSLFNPSSVNAANFRMGVNNGDSGSLSLADGTLTTARGSIADSTGSTQKLILGDGGRFIANDFIRIGSAGTGTVLVNSGGELIANNILTGSSTGSTGSLTLDGAFAKATSQIATFGVTGSSGVVVTHGGQLNSGFVIMASQAGSSSFVLIDANSTWNVNSGRISSGSGASLVTIGQGATMNSSGSTLDIGPNSQWEVSGTMNVLGSFGGTGVIVQNGGTLAISRGNVKVADSTGILIQSGGTLQLNDGSVTTSGLDLKGTFDFLRGQMTVDSGLFSKVGQFNLDGSFGTSTFTLANGVTTSGLTGLNIGSANNTNLREFQLLSGSTLSTSGNSSVGQQGSGSTMRVSGAGSVWNSGGLIAVGDGAGTLSVENAGRINMGNNSLLTGVSGAASNGTLNIQSGGVVNSGSVELARVTGSVSSATVTGTGSQLNATGLFIGGSSTNNGGTANLTIDDNAHVDIAGTTRVRSAGTLNLNGGQLTTQNFTRDTTGVFNFRGGTLTVQGGTYSNTSGALTLAGATASDNPTLTLEGSASTAGITSLNVGSSTRNGTLTLDTGSQLTTGAAVIASRGTLNLDGGTLNVSSFANNGTLNWSKGSVNYTSSISLDTAALNGLFGTSHDLEDNHTLASSAGTMTLGSSLNIDGGSLRPTNLINNSTMTVNSGDVQVASTFTNNTGHIVQLNGTSSLSAGTGISNNGTIQLNSPSAILSGGTLSNNNGGTLSGTGTIFNDVENNGTIRVSGSEHLVLAGGANTNTANINLSGGTIEVATLLVNRDGAAITGRGTFAGSTANIGGLSLSNDGLLSFSSGNTDIYGDVNQTGRGHIVTSGGGVTTFFDDVIHNGAEIRTFAGSRTVFLGAESGAGNFTGTGTVEFAGDLRPGNSPAIVSFEGDVLFNSSSNLVIELGGLNANQFDQLLVGGNLTLDGKLSVNLINGFALTDNEQFLFGDIAGSRFGLFSGLGEGALVGNFGGHDLFITYTAGNGNDLALITAVPEPSAFCTLGLAIAGTLATRLRRKKGAVRVATSLSSDN